MTSTSPDATAPFSERAGGVDVEPFECPLGAKVAEGAVVASRTDADIAALEDRIEMRGRCEKSGQDNPKH